MKTLRRLMSKWLLGTLEFILFLPATIILGILLAPPLTMEHWLLVLLLCYYLGSLSRALIGRFSQWVYLLLGAVVVAALFISVSGLGYLAILSWMIGQLFFFRGYQFFVRHWIDLFPPNLFWAGLAIYLLTSMFYYQVEGLQPYLGLYTVGGICTVIICLWMTNTLHLNAAKRFGKKEGTSLPKSLVRHNRILVLLFTILVFVIAFFSVIKKFVVETLKWIFSGIVWVFLWLGSLLSSGVEEPIPEGDGVDAIPELPLSEPSWLANFLSSIAKYVGMFLFILLFALLVWKLSQLLFKLVKIIIAKLQTRDVETIDTQGYIDENSKVISMKEMGQSYRDRFQQWLADRLRREPKWSQLTTNSERVRYLYRHWLLHRIADGFQYKPELTPSEIEQEIAQSGSKLLGNSKAKTSDVHTSELIQAYNDVRYGEKELDDEQVRRMRENMEKK